MSDQQTPPPIGEEIHLPGPTLQPVILTIGVTLLLLGLTGLYVVSAVGLILIVVTLIRWIKEARSEFQSLPRQH